MDRQRQSAGASVSAAGPKNATPRGGAAPCSEPGSLDDLWGQFLQYPPLVANAAQLEELRSSLRDDDALRMAIMATATAGGQALVDKVADPETAAVLATCTIAGEYWLDRVKLQIRMVESQTTRLRMALCNYEGDVEALMAQAERDFHGDHDVTVKEINHG